MKKQNSYDNKSTISEDTTNETFGFENLNITIDDESCDTYDDYSDIYVDDEYPTKKKKTNQDTIPKRYKRYNIRIIFMNILFLCISLISIYSLLFMPFAKIDIKFDNQTITNAVDNVYDTQLESLVGDYITKDDIKIFTQDMEIKFGEMNFKSIDFLKFGVDKDLSKTKKILSDYITTNLQQPITNLIDQASKSMLALSTKMALALIRGGNDTQITITTEQYQTLLETIPSVMENLNTGLSNSANTLYDALKPILEANGFDLKNQENTIKSKLEKLLEVIQKNGTKDGEFSMNNLILNLNSLIDGIKNINNTTYSLQADNSTPTNTTDQIIDNFIQNISDPAVLVDNIIDTLTPQQKQLVSYGIFTFGLFTCISAFVWACLAVTIVIRLFF